MRLFSAILCAVAVSAAGFFTRPASAAVSYYLDIDGIPGSSVFVGYEDWVEISAFGIAFQTPVSPGSSMPGKTSLKYLNFVKGPDRATAGILTRLWSGQPTQRIELAIVNTTADKKEEFAEWVFEDVHFTSWEQKSDGGVPMELFSLSPKRVKYTYREFPPKGGQLEFVAEWDFAMQTFSASGEVENLVFYTGTLVPEPATAGAMLIGMGLLITRRQSRRCA